MAQEIRHLARRQGFDAAVRLFHTVDEVGRKRVPLRYNKDKREKPVFSRGLSVCRSHFNSFSNIETDAKI